MATFLETNGVTYYLHQMLSNAKEKIILVSPYLKMNERIKHVLDEKGLMNLDIHIVYGKEELQSEQRAWLKERNFIRISYCNNLHAKCYLTETHAIITSMNLYDFSQVNNYEMGIYIEKAEDQTLYDNLWEEVQRIIHASKEEILKIEGHKSSDPSKKNNDSGYCIRTGVAIPFDLEKPMSKEAYQQWKQYANYTFKEKFCHFSGEPSHGETSMEKPILSKYWKKAQARHGFK